MVDWYSKDRCKEWWLFGQSNEMAGNDSVSVGSACSKIFVLAQVGGKQIYSF